MLNKVKPPPKFEFNHEVGIDVFDLKDVTGRTYYFLNMIGMATTFQVIALVGEAPPGVSSGSPKSKHCLQAFRDHWVVIFGLPAQIVCDRGVRNMGEFRAYLNEKNI